MFKCLCIVNENCIVLYFYTSCHVNENRWDFSFIIIFLCCSLVRNYNIKRPGFYTSQVTSVFSNFSQLKKLSKIKNTCEYYDLHKISW